jgi:hypothetical protein
MILPWLERQEMPTEQVVLTTLGQGGREHRSTLQAIARRPHHQTLANHSLEDHLK